MRKGKTTPALQAGDSTVVPPPATPHHHPALRRVTESSPTIFRTPYTPPPPRKPEAIVPPHLHGSLKRSYGDVGPVVCTHPEGPADPSHPAAAAQAANFPGISASRHAGSRGLNPARSAAAAADQLIAGFMRRHSDTATICTTLSR
ncbi:hypothetical protein PoMZ_00736 [Pyricularia oryzae]|uniref:Uncharacterized protein n=1 Tax=Pyricularia oryzae TaxID=318829 RepID=A0A4P7N2X9_PYROR|nr:hypothetical protein PoMZ_00736 [Pyricularia oryzae]